MYKKYGMEKTIKSLDGEFAFVLYDIENDDLYAGRDHLGIRGLFIGKSITELMIGSELKSMKQHLEIEQFRPAHYYKNGEFIQYYDYDYQIGDYSEEFIKKELNRLINRGCAQEINE